MKRILVIDDEPQVGAMLQGVLEDEGYEVVVARDGELGIEAFQCAWFDVVITDLLMPGKEGIETIRDLRKLRPDVKIIAVSGGDRVLNMDVLRMASLMGAQRTLKKPVGVDELLDAVRSLTDDAAA